MAPPVFEDAPLDCCFGIAGLRIGAVAIEDFPVVIFFVALLTMDFVGAFNFDAVWACMESTGRVAFIPKYDLPHWKMLDTGTLDTTEEALVSSIVSSVALTIDSVC